MQRGISSAAQGVCKHWLGGVLVCEDQQGCSVCEQGGFWIIIPQQCSRSTNAIPDVRPALPFAKAMLSNLTTLACAQEPQASFPQLPPQQWHPRCGWQPFRGRSRLAPQQLPSTSRKQLPSNPWQPSGRGRDLRRPSAAYQQLPPQLLLHLHLAPAPARCTPLNSFQ